MGQTLFRLKLLAAVNETKGNRDAALPQWDVDRDPNYFEIFKTP
jgi:hypothetical protein